MATTTPFLSLRKPTNTGGTNGKGDPIDVVADVSNNMDAIDDFASETDARFGTSQINAQAVSGTTTSFTFVEVLTGGVTCSFTFTAPPSGKVVIGNNCHIDNSTTQTSICSFIVRTGGTPGSGTTVYDAGDDDSIWQSNTNEFRSGTTDIISGLTPGAVYNVRQEFRVSGGATATFSRKKLNLWPTY